MEKTSNDWFSQISEEFNKPYYQKLYSFVKEEYATQVIYPPANEVFSALELTKPEDVKVVILGQDPYHNENQAHGLSFSVKPGQDIPPSLKNIYKELHEELGCYIPNNGYLVKWAKQGVLLLNTVLTVRAHLANSHQHKGWEEFTDAIIEKVNQQDRSLVYMLWGSPARKKAAMLNNPKHLVLEASHPSPLSAHRGFFGCGHFAKANEFLKENGIEPIDWQIENI
ncbi:Uracil-DNA glycosylase [Acetitomaculum ruminis DSM 5522]|uniref:Uracil-DNA glycosylase n=1 Tax=Acetitomaculum ruminis DSM 5522 TaxID=1120918 RepID=A0A1I0V2B5_9FIRM|nr:uracil-DNA glycosylase [Acetitomaculum ruminis]SFA70273.1 Uracil-DNA glycosylase [Acetitomaculum ruminis DSM 5522]